MGLGHFEKREEVIQKISAALVLVSWFFVSGNVFAGVPADKGESLRWHYKAGVDERFRVEYKQDLDFNDAAKEHGNLFYNRLRVNFKAALADEYLNNMADVFIEGLDARAGGYHLKGTVSQRDDFDLHQAYVSLYDIVHSSWGIRIGRQELCYGKGRLVAAPTWSNAVRSFDASVLRYRADGFYLDLLYGRNVKYKDGHANRSNAKDSLAGFYGGYQKDKVSPLWEGYFLVQSITNTATKVRRFTVGPRSQGRLFGGIVYDIEIPYQCGQTGSRQIKAWAAHLDLSKSFEGFFWKPQVVFEYNQATGDTDPGDDVSNTFIPLYQSTHDVYGGPMDLFRWENIREVIGRVNLSPTEKITLSPEVDVFWLESENDSWYHSSGTSLRKKLTGERSSYVGSQVSLKVAYSISKYVQLEGGVAHFFAGAYVKDTGAHDDVNWAYSQIILRY